MGFHLAGDDVWGTVAFDAVRFPDDPHHGFILYQARFRFNSGFGRDALIYAFGIILTFTGLGVALALLFGAAGINRFAANPYINLVITAIFLAFAFSLSGAYNLGVPASVLTKLDGITRSKESGKTIGLLLMGLTFSLTSFTCTAPLVGTILVAAAQGDLFYPIVGMLAFSSFFALPFFVLAVAPSLLQSLPRSGSWMNSVKVVMGFLEIGAALKFLSNVDLVWGWNIFTREVVIAGWIASFSTDVSVSARGFPISARFGKYADRTCSCPDERISVRHTRFLLADRAFRKQARRDRIVSAAGKRSLGYDRRWSCDNNASFRGSITTTRRP